MSKLTPQRDGQPDLVLSMELEADGLDISLSIEDGKARIILILNRMHKPLAYAHMNMEGAAFLFDRLDEFLNDGVDIENGRQPK